MTAKWDRIAEVLDGELASPLAWWWLSFTDATRPKGSQFLGVVIVQGHGMGTAGIEAHRLGINPGSGSVGFPIPEEHIPAPEYRNRLLSREEAEGLVG